jgi:hypothetical protein
VTTRVTALVLVAAVAAVGTADARRSGATMRPRLTVVGDSVAAALQYRAARRYLRRQFRLRLDAKVCRRLVAESCTYNGARAPSALEAIVAARESLAPTVVVDVGYNDDADSYGADLDRVMQALVRADVTTVIWTTLRYYGSVRRRRINALVRDAAARWPELRVADWNSWSRGHRSWFVYDGLHLNRTGALGLARLIRRAVRLGLALGSP